MKITTMFEGMLKKKVDVDDVQSDDEDPSEGITLKLTQ